MVGGMVILIANLEREAFGSLFIKLVKEPLQRKLRT